jgi:hypothetical protein
MKTQEKHQIEEIIATWTYHILRYCGDETGYNAFNEILKPIFDHMVEEGFIEYNDDATRWKFTEAGLQRKRFYQL